MTVGKMSVLPQRQIDLTVGDTGGRKKRRWGDGGVRNYFRPILDTKRRWGIPQRHPNVTVGYGGPLEGPQPTAHPRKRKNKEAVTNLLFLHTNPCTTVLLQV